MTVLSLLLIGLTFISTFGTDLTDTEAENMLSMHNDARSKTAKGEMKCSSAYGSFNDTYCPAGTIQKLKWDAGLANTAQTYADQLAAQTSCGLSHSSSSWRQNELDSETTTFSYTAGAGTSASGIGENLAVRWGSSSSTPYTTSIGWIEGESEYYTYSSSTPSISGEQIGHYTQVVSQFTEYVGCGCTWGTSCGSNTYHCVCHYYPVGNCNGCGGIDYTADAYPDDNTCNSCDSGDTCDSSTDYLCDDGEANGLGTPAPTDVTPSPTLRPTQRPVEDQEPETTEGSSGSGDFGDNPSSVYISNFEFPINDVPAAGDITQWTSQTDYPVYGPWSAYGYVFYIWYSSSWNSWIMSSSPNSESPYAHCQDSSVSTIVTNCQSWSYWGGNSAMSVVDTGDAYSITSSNNNSNTDDLINGLLIGLGIAVGLVLIIGLGYYCFKSKNRKSSQFKVVEMNNESDHQYVSMEN